MLIGTEKGLNVFNFEQEAIKYCSNDTLVLLLAVLCLEREMLITSNYQISFIASSSFTLAGLSSIFYRQCFMPKNVIGLISPFGYQQDKQSMIAEAWFTYENNKRAASLGKEQIRFNKNSIFGEFKVGTYKVDGHTSDYLVEFNGVSCLFVC